MYIGITLNTQKNTNKKKKKEKEKSKNILKFEF